MDRYAAIAESTYSKSFWAAICFVIGLVVLSVLGYSIPDEVINFVRDVIWIFVIPVTVKIIGVESLPKITELVRELRNLTPDPSPKETRRGK